MKTIVTHMSVDLDAVTSAWLVRKYFPGWQDAQFAFVPIEQTLNNLPPDANPDVIHVDTGFGRFDHHHIKGYLSATKLVFDYCIANDYIPPKERKPLSRVVDYVNMIDNFGEVDFHQPSLDLYDFLPHQLIFGIKFILKQDDIKVIEQMMLILESALFMMRNKTNAEAAIENGVVFNSKWGRTVAFESKNEEALKLALKSGFQLVVRKDPERGFLKIKLLPNNETNLEVLWERLKEADPMAHWGLHSSKNIITNGSLLNPHAKPTTISFDRAIEIIKQIY